MLRDGHPLDLVVDAAARRVARHLAGPRRPRRRAAHLPQRLPLLLRRPGAGRAARGAVRQGRRLPPVVPARQLHDAHATCDEADLERIEELRLSPLYVSLHAWDDDARVAPHGAGGGRLARRPRAARRGRPRAAPAGRAVPGLERRRRARRDRGARRRRSRPSPTSASCRSRWPPRATCAGSRPEDARRVVAAVAGWQARLPRAARQRPSCTPPTSSTCWPARMPPAGDAPEQYENGIGISAALLAEADAGGRVAALAARARRHGRRGVAVRVCCRGTLARAGARAGRGDAARRRRPPGAPFAVREPPLRPARHGHRAARRRRGAGRAARATRSPRASGSLAPARASCRRTWAARWTTSPRTSWRPPAAAASSSPRSLRRRVC